MKKSRLHLILDEELDSKIRRIGETKFGSGRNISHTITMMLLPIIGEHLAECQNIEAQKERQIRQALDLQSQRINNSGLSERYVQNLDGLRA